MIIIVFDDVIYVRWFLLIFIIFDYFHWFLLIFPIFADFSYFWKFWYFWYFEKFDIFENFEIFCVCFFKLRSVKYFRIQVKGHFILNTPSWLNQNFVISSLSFHISYCAKYFLLILSIANDTIFQTWYIYIYKYTQTLLYINVRYTCNIKIL